MGFREIVWQNPGSPTFTRELPRSFPREFPAMSRHFPGRSSHAFSLKFPREFPGSFPEILKPGICQDIPGHACPWIFRGAPGVSPEIGRGFLRTGVARISGMFPGNSPSRGPGNFPGNSRSPGFLFFDSPRNCRDFLGMPSD